MNTCPLCGEPLTGMVRSKPGYRPRLHVRCYNPNCPMDGRRRMTPVKYLHVCEAQRRDIFLNWTFDRCLSRPCPVTLTAALTLMVEASAVAPYKTLRAGYCRFVVVCWLPDLLAAAEGLMQRAAHEGLLQRCLADIPVPGGAI